MNPAGFFLKGNSGDGAIGIFISNVGNKEDHA